jgi:hypothetical protein
MDNNVNNNLKEELNQYFKEVPKPRDVSKV